MAKTVQKKKPKRTNKEQFARFVEAARKHGVNDSMEDFQIKFRKIVGVRPRAAIPPSSNDRVPQSSKRHT